MLPLMSIASTRSSGASSLTMLAIGCGTPSSKQLEVLLLQAAHELAAPSVTMTGTSTASVRTFSV